MKTNDVLLNPNELVQFLQKPARDFTRDDIIRFVEAKGITMINFRYAADDGKLKSLNFVPFSREHLESLPASCRESAENLLTARNFFEKDGIFPPGVIDNTVLRLKAYNDKGMSERLNNKQEKLSSLVRRFLHCG